MPLVRRGPRPVHALGAVLAALALAGCTASAAHRVGPLSGAAPAPAPAPVRPSGALEPSEGSAPAVVTDDISVAGPLNRPVVGGVRTSSGTYLVSADGGVFALSHAAPFIGSMGGKPLANQVVALAADPSGTGYWLAGADGGVFAFDRPFLGSRDLDPLRRPIAAMAATPSGRGYWLAAADGGVFAFGDAVFAGSAADRPLGAPIVAMASTLTGHGYWLVSADGGVFAFGDAPYLGSAADVTLAGPAVGVLATPSGEGYWVASADGGVYAFGDAPWLGSPLDVGRGRVVGITAAPDGYRLVTDRGALLAPGDRPPAPPVTPVTTSTPTTVPAAGADPAQHAATATASRSKPPTVTPATVALTTTTTTSAPVQAKATVDPAPPVATAVAAPGMAILAALNDVRAANGLSALDWDPQLADLASSWSATMARSSLHHRDLGAVMAQAAWSSYRSLGENLYMGPTGQASAVVNAWMASAPHRAQILNGSFNRVGVGVATGGGEVWVTADFGTV